MAVKYTYDPYKESDVVKQAKAAAEQHAANRPGAYQGSYTDQLNDTMKQIMNREKFSYDLNGDALYRQYKDQYTTQGKLAMMDTMGQAAALTGGYGNSYAQSVGQQAYQGQLQQLNAVIPELYQLAMDQYNQKGQELLNQYSMLSDQDAQEYGRYRDSVADYQSELDRLTEAARYAAEDDYGKYIDQQNMDYSAHRDKVADSQWEAEFAEAKRQYDTSLAEEQRQYDASLAEEQRQYDAAQPTGYAAMTEAQLVEELQGANNRDDAVELAWQMIEGGADEDTVFKLVRELYETELTGSSGSNGGSLRQIHPDHVRQEVKP